MICDNCGADIGHLIAAHASVGGVARAASLTKAKRMAIAKKAWEANLARSKRSKAETRAKQSEGARLAWARRRAK